MRILVDVEVDLGVTVTEMRPRLHGAGHTAYRNSTDGLKPIPGHTGPAL